MSEFSKVALGKSVESMDLSPQFDAYSGVEIIVDEETAYFSGTRIGRVLPIENEWGTQEQADSILESLQNSGFQYQPLRASRAILDPAAELGDGVTVNGVYTGLYKFSRIIGSLMPAEIETPKEEEIDHEYPYEAKENRVFKRELGAAKAQIRLNQDSIEAEVLRASEAEGTLSSLISQNAASINAKVSQTGGDNASFGWSLLANKFSLFAGSKEVFKCTASGVEINGKITATSGYIGNGSSGFAITATSLYNGMASLNSGANGVYLGTDGIALGGGKFKVTKSGDFTANNATLTGTLTIGGERISAATLRSGAQSAYNNSGKWNGTSSTVSSNGGYWSGGGVAGTKFTNMANNTGAYPINASSFRVNGTQYSPRDITISDQYGTRTFRGVLMYSVGG